MALLTLMGIGGPASAASFNFVLNTEFTGGAIPSGFPTVVIQDDGTNTVKLTITSNLSGTEFLSDLYLNYGGSALGSLASTFVGGQQALSVAFASDGFNGGGGRNFDIHFAYETANNANRFTGGENSIYTLTGTNLHAADFNFLSSSSGGKTDYAVSAHIQGIIPQNGEDSGFVGSGIVPPIPDPDIPLPVPGGIALLGIGLVAMALTTTRRNRQAC